MTAAYATHLLPPGARVGSYVIVRQLAEGGMGAVYEAEHRVTRQRRALKVVLPELGYDPEFRARFLREVTIASSVKHANLVDTQDPIEEGGILALPMELLYGETLQQRLSRSRMLVPEVIDVLVPACHGVHAVHLANVIHRDLKPANIFLARIGESIVPKVLDFGAARPVGDADLTQVGYVVGSPFYMAPEQAEGRTDLDPRVDVFAMGVIAFQCLTGRRPYEADSPQSAVVKLLEAESFPRPGELDRSVPRAIENVVMKALAYDRQHRYGSLAELAEALTEAAFDGGDVTTSPAVSQAQPWGVEATVIRELPDAPPVAPLMHARPAPVEPPSAGSGVRVSNSGVMAPVAAYAPYAPQPRDAYGAPRDAYGAPPTDPYGAPPSGSYGVPSGSYGLGPSSMVQPGPQGPPSSVLVSPSSFPPPMGAPSPIAPSSIAPPSPTGAFAAAPPPMSAPAPRGPTRQQIAIGVSALVLVAAALGWALAPDDEAPVVVAPPIVAPPVTQVAAPPPIYAPPSEVAPLPAPLPTYAPTYDPAGPMIVSPPPPPVTVVAAPPPTTAVEAPEPAHSSHRTHRGPRHGSSRRSGSGGGSGSASGSGSGGGTSRRWIE